ncbi:MAG TPA: hypothetical protein DEB17_02335 [Chlorobaculum sp.]|uniref:Uncharacterized protein n=1 Tax=Chlorobaculum tepidum (strain ATCC 49652 / DSM 12025 / NBRC 103806 / TLS) TaxID=194439 RepID=Q8KEP7_CHLTE|nr:hypothetical protein CT0639 [Chlorobaculum tepidum TLS]HBU22835.1 hypothetical protein [Chlorobaculum sp.]
MQKEKWQEPTKDVWFSSWIDIWFMNNKTGGWA